MALLRKYVKVGDTYINADAVQLVTKRRDKDSTEIDFTGGGMILVRESVEEVVALLRGDE